MAHIEKNKNKLLARISRIRGQLDAFKKAIEEDHDEYEVMQLLASCRGALNGLTTEFLEGHIREHIVNAKDKKNAGHAGEELINIIRSFMK